MNEKQIEKDIIGYLRWQGYYAEGIQSGVLKQTYNGKDRYVHLCTAGTPDIIACINRAFVGTEVKKDSNEYKKWNKIIDAHVDGTLLWNTSQDNKKRCVNQYEQGRLIDKAGGDYWLVTSVEEVQNLIEFL